MFNFGKKETKVFYKEVGQETKDGKKVPVYEVVLPNADAIVKEPVQDPEKDAEKAKTKEAYGVVLKDIGSKIGKVALVGTAAVGGIALISKAFSKGSDGSDDASVVDSTAEEVTDDSEETDAE